MLHVAPFIIGSLAGYTAAVKLMALYTVMKEQQEKEEKENLNEVMKDEDEELENLND